MTVTYRRDEPTITQNDSWSCGPSSTRWALKALGRNPSEQWIENTMLAEGVVTQEHGLMDATGAGLAAFIRRHYGEYGYDSNHEPSISWDWIVREGGANPDGSGHQYPVLIGGRAWVHWTAVRDYHAAAGVLLLANPANEWKGVGQIMSRQQFAALGRFSAVRIWHPDLLQDQPEPVPPQPPGPSEQEVARAVRAKLSAAIALIDALHPPT